MKFKNYDERSLWEDVVRETIGIGDPPKEAIAKADTVVKEYRVRIAPEWK